MSHGTVAVLATEAKIDRGAIETALSMTETEGSHLDIYCLGIETTPPDSYFAGTAVLLSPPDREAAEQRAQDLAEALRPLIPSWRGNVALHPVMVPGGLISDQVGRLARYADRIVAAAPYGPEDRPLHVATLEAALFAGGIPVIVVPDGGAAMPERPERIAVAWDDSREAMVAIRAALPMLRRAALVEIVIVDPETRWGDRSDPGGALALYLARNGVTAEISVLNRSRPRVSEVLLRHLRDNGAEALVMGGYGHSRLREALFGGTTREMLEAAALPLILAR
ncbi:universal stress protein [Limimaricola pyoseonensis]|uniref:Nucleotide-binding universal stress protein, UspA family n=1 Tax=Limimaricola pyoseonensis TaxID=521013 RepID=A0A1G7G1M9_9RHOB|nr:universal stress protein [Limimaricola pyoseonensis]SDE82031.1 Nucleotide-binding universal stress protein, UspA family [Limimaricola pyoseonensis]